VGSSAVNEIGRLGEGWAARFESVQNWTFEEKHMRAELTVVIGIEVPEGTELDDLSIEEVQDCIVTDSSGLMVNGSKILGWETIAVLGQEDFVLPDAS
jgi:hypothetical protein